MRKVLMMIGVGMMLLAPMSLFAQSVPIQTLHDDRTQIIANLGLPDEFAFVPPVAVPTEQLPYATITRDGQWMFYCIESPEITYLHAYYLPEQRLLWTRQLDRGGYCTFGDDFVDGDRFFMSVSHYSLYFPPDDAEGDVYSAGIFSLTDGTLLQAIPAYQAEMQSDHAYAITFEDGLLTLGIGAYPYKGTLRNRNLYSWDGATLTDIEDDPRNAARGVIYDNGVMLYSAWDTRIRVVGPMFGEPTNSVRQFYQGVDEPLVWLQGDIISLIPLSDGSLDIVYYREFYTEDAQPYLNNEVMRVNLQRDGTLGVPVSASGFYDAPRLLYTAAQSVDAAPFISTNNFESVQMAGMGTPCEAALPSRLRNFAEARVINGASNLRTAPTTNSSIDRVIAEGAIVPVSMHAICDAAGILWWDVWLWDEQKRFYIAELQGNSYFLEPVTP